MIRSLLSYMLCLALLVSLMNVTVYTHTCHLFNKSETSLFIAPDCICTDASSSDATKIQFSCCSTTVKHFSANHDLSVEQAQTPQFIATYTPTTFHSASLRYRSIEKRLNVVSRPPPLAHHHRSLLQIYLI